jgi:hypothetical protein
MSGPLLSPAPPPPVRPGDTIGDNPAPLVLLAGIVTTGLALLVVYAVDLAGTNIMGWHADYVLPVGALLVGVVASSGYGLAAWRLHCKVTGRLLWWVLALTTAAYFGAQFIEYRLIVKQLGEPNPIGFWSYFDLTTRSFRWEEAGRVGSELGALGYGLRALELAGFLAGGIVGPVLLRRRPYCDRCRRYKDHPLVAVLPAGVPPEKVKSERKAKKDGWYEREADAQATARAGLEAIFTAARNGSFELTAQSIVEHGPLASRKAAEALSGFLSVLLVHCPRCSEGALVAELTVRRPSNRHNRTVVRNLGEVLLSKTTVEQFLHRKS